MVAAHKTTNDARRQHQAESIDHLVLRPLPKVIFLYPLLIASLVLALLAYHWPAHLDTYASLFIAITFLNLAVLAFDVPKTGMLTIYALAAAVVLGLILIKVQWGHLLPGALKWVLGLHATADSRFYVAFSVALGVLLLVVLLMRFKADAVVITPMEVRQSVFLGGSVSYPMDQIANHGIEEPDVFEHLLLRCGRVWIQPIGERTIVIEHVPRIRLRERQLSHLFSHRDVKLVRQ